MPYVAPSTVAPGQTYSATAHNVIVEDIIDHEARIVVAAAAIVPTGSLTPYIGTTAPTGWLLCEGQEVSRATYSALWDVLRAGGASSPYGNGNGSTTFNVPDLRGRMAVGKGTNTDVDALGDSDGESTVGNRRPKHYHNITGSTNTTGAHSHSVAHTDQVYQGTGPGVWPQGNNGVNGYGPGNQGHTCSTNGDHSHTVSGTAGQTSNAPLDGPAFLTVNYIIKF